MSMPSTNFAASAPPVSAMMLVHITSSGIATPSASTRGRISRSPCGMPITRIASSSSVTRITPICAVIAEPERPATRIADSTGPSSRITDSPRMFTM
ncbi:hypothetical protein BamIOP4010DRAFT_6595 [Burkholderia ambifaria IOP40-10]|uniref:Uncharacterized protein n=1 Tax=Burkholderia ambifaria IOP40-10 TaxID=396596 RepID=B1FRD4_9BURK|nr:hypothetical protein BamIOP4010DRAFT_6595 [Burkholderia ambifaria IOP40-10]